MRTRLLPHRAWAPVVPGLLLFLSTFPTSAQPAAGILDEQRFTEVELRNLVELPAAGFLGELEGGLLTAGRNALFLDPAADPLIANNNFRHLLRRHPGAMLVEEELQGVHFNVGFRGMTPNNGILTPTYQDGFPLNVDTFGTRFVASVPDVNQISRAQFLHGGTGVLAGSQAGGVVNLFSYPAAGDQPWRVKNTATVGYRGYVGELFEASGTLEEFSYSAFGRYARGDGFPATPVSNQPGFDHTSAGFTLTKRFQDTAALTLGYNMYLFDSDAISGVALATGGVNNLLNYYFQDVDRHAVNLLYEHNLGWATRLETRAWYHDTEGVRDYTPTATLGIVRERFHYAGIDTRLSHTYDLGPLAGNILTAGFVVQGAESPLTGTPSTAGTNPFDLDRHDFNWALFAENKFQLVERWSVTPGVRFEYAEVAGDGARSAVTPNVDRHFDDTAPLFSLGTEVDVLAPRGLHERPLVAYASLASGYRPPTYNETVNQGAGTTLAGNLENAHLHEGQLGLRGTPARWLTYDVTGFWISFKDQFATVGGVVQNAGDTRHRGVESFVDLDWFGLCDWLNGVPPPTEPRLGPRSPATETGLARWGRLSTFAGVTWLDTEIRRSPFAGANGLDVPYAPEWTLRTGVAYNYFERIKAVLSFSYYTDYLGNVNNDHQMIRNNSAAVVPGYGVLDLALEHTCWNDRLTVFVNLNNLLDRQYFTGFQGGAAAGNQLLAPRFNAYGGLRLSF
jgi:Fe(3+) dicitrate transport protein